MQQGFEIVDWQEFKLPSAERKQRDSLKRFERSVEVWKDWICLKKESRKKSQHLVKSRLQRNCYQVSAGKKVWIQQRGTQAERSLDDEL